MHACIDRIIQTINIRNKKMMLQSITTEIMRNDNFFFTDNQNLWRKSRFHELGIRRMPRFFFLNLHTGAICSSPSDVTSESISRSSQSASRRGTELGRMTLHLLKWLACNWQFWLLLWQLFLLLWQVFLELPKDGIYCSFVEVVIRF